MKQINTFKSDSGKLHETEFDAWRDDLETWLVANGINNPGILTAVQASIVHDLTQRDNSILLPILEGLRKSAPPRATPIYPEDIAAYSPGFACGDTE